MLLNDIELIKMLNLRDTRYIFYGYELKKFNGLVCNFFKARLSYIPDKCYKCGIEKINNSIVKNGTDVVEIQINSVANRKTYLKIKKQRVMCKSCNSNYLVNCLDHKKHCTISKQLYNKIGYDLTNTVSSVKQISEQNFVSPITTNRKLSSLSNDVVVNKNSLPKVICIDEFRGVYTQFRKLNCNICCWNTGKIIDILPTRDKNNLEKFFKSYSKSVRDSVEYFCTDMFQGFISAGEKYLKNAKIVIDRFHIINLLKKVMIEERIKVMKKFKKDSLEYKILKNRKYNSLLTKNFKNLKISYHKNRYGNNLNTEQDFVSFMLSLSKDLEENYYIYQTLIECFQNKDIDSFKHLINNIDIKNCSLSMQTAIKTLKKFEKYIINAIIYPYSNGVIEGKNNKIKVLKRNAFGFRNFKNFRTRILLTSNIILKEKNKKKIVNCK